MTFLSRRVEVALARLGHIYLPLDVKLLRKRAQDLNSAIWEKIRNHHLKAQKGKKSESDLYQQWLAAGRFRAIVTYGTEEEDPEEIALLTAEERERLEPIAIQNRWASLLRNHELSP